MYDKNFGTHLGYVKGCLASKRLGGFFDLTKYKTFVETGTFLGDGLVWAVLNGFEKSYSVEIEPTIHARAVARFSRVPNVEISQGSTIDFLSSIVSRIEGPTLFYLDAHWSGTHLGVVTGKIEDNPVPLREESLILSGYKDIKSSLIVVDDERLMVDPINPPNSWGAHVKQDLFAFWKGIGFHCAYLDDSMIFYMP